MLAAIAGCAGADFEPRNDSIQKLVAEYREQNCSFVTAVRELSSRDINNPNERMQRHGQEMFAASSQVEREKGCLTGNRAPAAGEILPSTARTVEAKKSSKSEGATSQRSSKAQKAVSPNVVSPKTRGWLGVVLLESPIPLVLAASLGLPEPKGVFVQGATSDSAAKRAGMRSMDVILTADGKEYPRGDALISYLESLPSGHKLKLKVWRGRSVQEITIPLSATKPDAMASINGGGYCYVTAFTPMEGLNNLVWVSYIFPVADEQSQLYARGQAAGEAFKNFLQQEKVPQNSSLKGFGMCSPSLNSLTTSLNAEIASHRSPAFTATGSEGVLLYWQPN